MSAPSAGGDPPFRHTMLGICLARSACAQLKVRLFTGCEEGHAGHHCNGHNRSDCAQPEHGADGEGAPFIIDCIVGQCHFFDHQNLKRAPLGIFFLELKS
jgi:hypothetical protein